MSISASAVLSLQTRINNERSRRGLSSVGFTGGVTSGSNIRAPHINELRSYTETLNTLGSVSFGWSGNVAAGADITDALSQIGNFVTTLEGEGLASWKTLPYSMISDVNNNRNYIYSVPEVARGVGKFRWKVSAETYDGNLTFWMRGDSSAPIHVDQYAYYGVFARQFIGQSPGGFDRTYDGIPLTQWMEMPEISTVNHALPAYQQTPYLVNDKAGFLYNPQRFNCLLGQLSADNNGSQKYHPSLNYWYYNPRAFTSTWDTATLVASEKNGVYYPINNLTVEAYY